MQRIQGLDGLRAIAFLLVFFFHAHYGYFGWVGVQLFFVLSGFLITRILLDMKAALPKGRFFIKFYGRRFLRIFPLYYLYLLIASLVASYLLSQHIRKSYMELFWDQVPYALAYIYNFFMATSLYERASQFVTHMWSLALEEQFYIFWPMVIFLAPLKNIKKAFLAVIFLAPVFRLATYLFYQYQPWFEILRQEPTTAVYVLPFSQFDSFAFGALLTVLPRIPRAKTQFFILLVGLPLLGMLTDFLTTGVWNVDNGFGLPLALPNAYKSVWGYSLLNYLFMLLIYGVAREGWFLGLLEHPWMRYLGKISYGLYVYHYAILWLLSFVLLPESNDHLTTIIALILIILIASLSFHAFEKPVMDLKDRWFNYSSQASDTSAASIVPIQSGDL
jgi:peptidoglycan/LPS O-acetylase OafA/YrhL